MDDFIDRVLATVPVGLMILVLGLLNRQAIRSMNYRLGKLEEHFINHLKNHAEKGGEN